jgi:NAD(P)-dependent dehydrogenase (short-subunit alcohol dehydrogenase family)
MDRLRLKSGDEHQTKPMARIFITGSADGLGLLAAKNLVEQGHRVTLHARNEARAADARKRLNSAENVIIGDVSTLTAMRDVATKANASGAFDAVIHNVAIGYQEPKRVETVDGLEQQFAINALAPYVLTALMTRPKRLIYLSSGLHRGGHPDLADAQWKARRWNGSQAYSDTKLFNVMLAFAIARRWSDVYSNALEPGWVPTKMGGRGAPDDLQLGAVTQAWLAVSDDKEAKVSGEYFFHQKLRDANPAAHDVKLQDALISYFESLSKIALP